MGSKQIYIGDEQIGNASDYSALPSTPCPACGSKLHRVYNTQTAWKYICLSEKKLVDIEAGSEPVNVVVIE